MKTVNGILTLFEIIPQVTTGGFSHFGGDSALLVDGVSKDRVSDIACNYLKSFLPRTFTHKDSAGQLCLAYWCDADRDFNRLIIVPFTDSLVHKLKTGEITLGDAAGSAARLGSGLGTFRRHPGRMERQALRPSGRCPAQSRHACCCRRWSFADPAFGVVSPI